MTSVKPVAAPDGLRLMIAIANTGNAFTKGSGVVTVADTKLNFPFKIDTFVSHTAINYRVPWTRTVVPGDHQVSVRLTYDGGRVTTWNGTITIAGALQRQLQKSLQRDGRAAARGPASSHSSTRCCSARCDRWRSRASWGRSCSAAAARRAFVAR